MSGPLRQQSVPPTAAQNGYRGSTGPLAARALPTRVRPKGYTALAVALIVGLGALGYWFYSSAGSKVAIVVAVRDVPVGHVIGRSDLSTIEVAGGITAVAGDHMDEVVGKRARVEILPNSPVQLSMVSTGSLLRAGQGLVGVAEAPGQIPSSGLMPGDRVEVLQLTDKNAAPTASSPPGHTVLVAAATVYDARANPASSGGSLLTLIVPQTAAYAIAQASDAGLVALVKVGS